MRLSTLPTLTAAVLLAFALALLASVALAAGTDAGRGQVKFVARQSEVALEGNFRTFRADIDFDPAHPQAGTVKVAIELASADAGGADADNLLKSREFFDVEHFPRATFEANAIAPAANGGFQASGAFTLKGRSAPIVVPFTARRDGATTWYEGGVTLSRLAWHVGEGQWADTGSLDDEVLIQFKVPVNH